MKREFLEKLGLEKDVIDQIMKEHGKTLQSAKPEDYDELKSQSINHEKIVKELKDKLAAKDTLNQEADVELLEKVKNYELKDLKLKVAREYNIPYDLALRLNGDTEEDLIADAQSFAPLVNQKEILPLKSSDEGSTENDHYKKMLEDLDA